jgi:hypothetical protein
MCESLRKELTNQSERPPGSDRRIGAFSLAMLSIVKEPKPKSLVDAMTEKRPNVKSSFAANIILRAFQKQLIDTPDYPQAYDEQEVWRESIHNLLGDESTYADIRQDLLERNPQSNVVERYKAFKIIMSLFGNRLGDSPRVLDIGCSRNHGLKKLALDFPFENVGYEGQQDKIPNNALGSLIDNALGDQTPLYYGLGTDIIDLGNEATAKWAKSCSFYPSELLDKARVSEYDILDTQPVSNVEFKLGDFSKTGIPSLPPEKQFDVITASTVLYQLEEKQREIARKLFRDYLSRNGIIIYQDFAQTDSKRKTLLFKQNWFNAAYSYETILEFGENEGYLSGFLRWDNGRCNKWMPGKDFDEALNKK